MIPISISNDILRIGTVNTTLTTIYNIGGKVVLQTNQREILVSSLTNGKYGVSVLSNGKLQTQIIEISR
jgi:hypothetical protein